jgi:hypothetical protein
MQSFVTVNADTVRLSCCVCTVYVSYKHNLCITACEYGVLGGCDSDIIHY